MLSDYIEAYKKAVAEKNEKEIKRLERELAQLGMDRATLRMLIKEA